MNVIEITVSCQDIKKVLTVEKLKVLNGLQMIGVIVSVM